MENLTSKWSGLTPEARAERAQHVLSCSTPEDGSLWIDPSLVELLKVKRDRTVFAWGGREPRYFQVSRELEERLADFKWLVKARIPTPSGLWLDARVGATDDCLGSIEAKEAVLVSGHREPLLGGGVTLHPHGHRWQPIRALVCVRSVWELQGGTPTQGSATFAVDPVATYKCRIVWDYRVESWKKFQFGTSKVSRIQVALLDIDGRLVLSEEEPPNRWKKHQPERRICLRFDGHTVVKGSY